MRFERGYLVLFLVLVVAAASCGEEQECGKLTKLGDPICCGKEGELPGISCIDLSNGGSIYGDYGSCLPLGHVFDAKFVGAHCCDGLAQSSFDEETDELFTDDYPPGCKRGSAAPSSKLCIACGNGFCEENENRCRCPADCGDPIPPVQQPE